MLDRLTVVLFRPKLSENIGSVARACANMGCGRMILVQPRDWDPRRAASLATPQGTALLDRIEFSPDLASALSPFAVVYGTTARTGGWRKGILTPAEAAPVMAGDLRQGLDVAVVFGPEDTGLTNAEIDICGQLLTIPTMAGASSLNLSQAVLVILYECFKLASAEAIDALSPPDSRPITRDEYEVLMTHMEQALAAIDFIRRDNLRYWMMPLRRFMQRIRIRRNEFNLLMGICRQVTWIAGRTEKGKGGPQPPEDIP